MVMIRGHNPFKYWKKGLVLLVGLFIIGSQAYTLAAFYIGFWFARWTYNIKIVRVKKKSGDATKGEESSA